MRGKSSWRVAAIAKHNTGGRGEVCHRPRPGHHEKGCLLLYHLLSIFLDTSSLMVYDALSDQI
jgi:hypothetical protein